jgi:RND superfamily putative drug exporter
MNKASDESVSNTTWATIALVVIILLVVYRSPLLALIPILTIALSVWFSLMAIAVLARLPGLNFQVINITNLFVIVVLFGAGTDYCLFLIARYREELIRGMGRDEALREAISKVGGALVASAGTVIVGLGMLWFSSFAKIQYTGPAIALSLAIGLVAALTLAPVLLHWLRGAVFWPFQQPHHERGADVEAESLEQLPMSGFWAGVADLIVRRPGVIMALCVLALTPLAVIGARTKSNSSQLADLNPDHISIVGAHMIQRHFPVGELGPTSILIEHPRLDFRSNQGRAALDQLSQRLAAIPNVAEVRSASQPLGVREAPDANVSMFDRLRRQTLRLVSDSRYISVYAPKAEDRNHITRIDLVFKTDPFSDPSLRALDSTRRVVMEASGPGGPLEGASASGVTGSSALVNDLKTVTQKDERKMYILVTLGVYVILVLLLRRPGICLYLMVTVLVGYLASLGITELVFQALHTGPGPWVGLDWKVGFFLFVILVAVGEDYNIFLMSRVIEEEQKHGLVEGTRRAVTHTGGIISSCGLIMAGTFGSMLTGSLTALRELGFALGLGVLLDTFLVRPVLVPAFLVLLERARQRRRLAASPVTEANVEATTTSG